MIRGTTPTIKFTLPFQVDEIDTLSVAFAQNGVVILEKKKNDCVLDGNTITLTLSEADTLSLVWEQILEIQIRCYCGATKLASNIIKTTVGRILKDGVLSDD